MTEPRVSKLRPAELRRMAAKTRDAERERKMLAMAEALERVAGAEVEQKPGARPPQ
jgi:hypothetical protein